MAAEAIVSTVLEQLTSILMTEAKKEVRLVVGVKKEIEKLTTKFKTLQAVLGDAEQRQVKETGVDNAVGVWLDRLKAVSYDMDDILDEWNTEILELQIEEDANAQFWKKVCFLFSHPCFCFRQIALRHNTGVKIKEINDELDSIAKDKDQLSLNAIRSVEDQLSLNAIRSVEDQLSLNAIRSAIRSAITSVEDQLSLNAIRSIKEPQRLKTTPFVEVSEIRGREKVKINLVNKLLSESKQERASLPVISLVGLGGIGKTTLAQLAYHDAKIKAKFDYRIWVCVSEPFDEVRIARAIIEDLTDRATDLVEFHSLLKCLRKTIENKKFILFLDDVWEENDDKWKQLYNSLNDGLRGESKIVVTTRKEKVVYMMKSTDVINIGVLSRDESWSLFTQLAFWNKSHDEELVNIGRAIVGKCKGLPLAIKVIGSLLRRKKTRDQWQRILDSEIWKVKELEKDIFPTLLLSYNDLPYMVKRCFSYCAIFPKDYVMHKDELIKLWMAQGYLGLKHDEETEIIGEECFDTIAMHSFFQEFSKDPFLNDDTCKMHDIVHDFAQFLVKNECFSKEIYGSEEASLDVSCEKARHSMLILKSSYNVNISSVQKLRSLLIEDGHRSKSISCFSPDLVKQMTCLRSLKLSGSWDDKILTEIGKLIHLRYLNMSELKIKELPENFCCLYNLQTLDIRYCKSLVKLPKGMGKLINLRHLLNRGTKNLRYMPKEMERLVCLRTLDRFIVGGDPNGMGLGCLKHLNKLRGRLMIKGLGEVVGEAEAKNAQLMNKKNLVELQLYFDSTSNASDEESTSDEESASGTELVEECNNEESTSDEESACDASGTELAEECNNEESASDEESACDASGTELVEECNNEESASDAIGTELVEECNKDSAVLEALQPPPNLEILLIDGCSMTLPPHWMVSLIHLSLIHLKKLSLQFCRNCEYLPALGKLPLLEDLRIWGLKSVKRVGNEFVGIETSSSSSSSLIAFPKLKTLYFRDMENLEEWEYKITAGDITIMPSLSHLDIGLCPKLKSLPDHLLHATTLQTLNIFGCGILHQLYKVEISRSSSGEKWSSTLKKKMERCESNTILNCP